MSNKKTYVVEWDYKADVRIEIDHDLITDELLHEINNFWGGAEERIEEEGSVLNAVLKLLAQEALSEQVRSLYNVAEEFKTEPPEGWPKLDGSCGIKLLSCDEVTFDRDDMTIKCLPQKSES